MATGIPTYGTESTDVEEAAAACLKELQDLITEVDEDDIPLPRGAVQWADLTWALKRLQDLCYQQRVQVILRITPPEKLRLTCFFLNHIQVWINKAYQEVTARPPFVYLGKLRRQVELFGDYTQMMYRHADESSSEMLALCRDYLIHLEQSRPNWIMTVGTPGVTEHFILGFLAQVDAKRLSRGIDLKPDENDRRLSQSTPSHA
ncbi:hypothetical protein GGR56DRAFT_694532 [Xylariaceae sp. FL0804]|nr:hypothetical protein GGR56DRAFT_694532 [Xylariaceae sp. FL0804]